MSEAPLPDEQTERYQAASFAPDEDEEADVAGALTVLQGPRLGTVYDLHHGRNVLGRGEDADVQVVFEGVSRRHAQIVERGGSYVLGAGSSCASRGKGPWSGGSARSSTPWRRGIR